MNPEELKIEIMNNQHHRDYVLDPTKINKLNDEAKVNVEDRDNSEESIEIEDVNTTKDENFKSRGSKQVNEYMEAPLREISYQEANEDDENQSAAESYQKAKDYVSYGYDYMGVEMDPQKVDVNLPVADFCLQLLWNPKWTDEIFKERMLEYQYHKDKPIERQINIYRRELNKCKIINFNFVFSDKK